ncbi:SDR family oxidoreductase [Bacillaceae bacterium SIJ1]|uniref:SDR family NAD(P)-dependent oxidoreductase n=1 Tax=Litoribacterium kuwaitense TaxID=1398745 RepID=UPI0013EB62AE|nr:SDR family NAD(P)-dependent oxidoreductase [Litoribacterium kuwaitense]NGP45449.1 SDR family oxidoreductase [Litoribacterium kuwaitense]
MSRFTNRNVLVTGSARGIGAAIVRRFAEEGANIVINYLGDSDREAAAEVQQEIAQAFGTKVILVQGDVGKKADVENMFAEAERELGPIEVLVNNAGVAPFEPFLKVTEDTWDRTFETNVKGMFLTSQRAAPSMIERGYGKIVNVASTASLLVTSPVIPHYIASKAAAHQLTKALGIELGKHGINVNAVGPSTVETDMVKEYLQDEQIYQQEVEANPMKRLGTAKQIADAVLFLSSEEAMQVNGHLLMVDGGLTVKAAQPEDHMDH